MGLDMYAFTTSDNIPAADFVEPNDCAELYNWRKHPNLHGLMENLYRRKGGTYREFNVLPVRIYESDLQALGGAVTFDGLPFTTGFLFGQSQPEHRTDDLEFIRKAHEAFKAGKKLLYTSWW